MSYLHKEASNLHFEISRFHFHTDELSWTHYLDRMVTLTKICDPNDPVFKRAMQIILSEEWDISDEWLSGNEGFNKTNTGGGDADISDEIQQGLTRDTNNYLQFLSKIKGLDKWVFHQYDADFHPSIPHGHFKSKKHPKLDAYLGWIYKGSQQVDRLSRNLIIELWNDDEFRLFARTSIEWYMGKFPNYNWRITTPLRLPRRR